MNKQLFSFSYADLKAKILSIDNLKDAALFCTTYACCARVGEITKNRYHPERQGIQKSQIEVSPTHLIFSIQTEKTGQWRKVPVSRGKEEWLCGIILDYLGLCGEVLFPYTTKWAEHKFKKYFGTYNIHLLRHWATTHALQGHRTREPLMPQEVARLGGWVDFNTFYRVYGHFTVEDFIHKI